MNPFDYVNAILQNKKQLIVDESSEKDYTSFLVNRSLSYHKDCIMYANEMNRRHFLDKKLQNDFLLNTVRSQKRPFAKWAKVEKSEDLEKNRHRWIKEMIWLIYQSSLRLFLTNRMIF